MLSQSKRLLHISFFLLVASGVSFSQETTATFYGVVTDSTGAVVPSAKITFSHNETGTVVTKETDAAGEFQFDFLRVGAYTLSIQAQGFKRFESTGITLAASQRVRQSFVLEVGAVTETVQVTGQALQV